MHTENLFSCVGSFFTELAKQPIKSAFALVLLYLAFSASEEEKQQILYVLLKYLESPTNSVLLPICLFVFY